MSPESAALTGARIEHRPLRVRPPGEPKPAPDIRWAYGIGTTWARQTIARCLGKNLTTPELWDVLGHIDERLCAMTEDEQEAHLETVAKTLLAEENRHQGEHIRRSISPRVRREIIRTEFRLFRAARSGEGPVTHRPRQASTRGKRRNTRIGPRRARAPGSKPDPEPDPIRLAAASSRLWAHVKRREARSRVTA